MSRMTHPRAQDQSAQLETMHQLFPSNHLSTMGIRDEHEFETLTLRDRALKSALIQPFIWKASLWDQAGLQVESI